VPEDDDEEIVDTTVTTTTPAATPNALFSVGDSVTGSSTYKSNHAAGKYNGNEQM
jgi:hypothetical protein